MALKILVWFFSGLACLNLVQAASDSSYYLIVGDKKCPLLFSDKIDSTSITIKRIANPSIELLKDLENNVHVFKPGSLDTVLQVNPIILVEEVLIVKDTIIKTRYLRETVATKKTSAYFRKTTRVDTVMDINPATLAEEMVIIPNNKFDIKNDLGDVNYTDFIEHVKSGFKIQGKNRTLTSTEVSFYYETPNDCGSVTLKYPKPDSLLLQQLTALINGGFVYLYNMVMKPDFITEPIYLETYFSINNAFARPQATKNVSSISRIPYTLPFQDSAVTGYYSASTKVLYAGIENRVTISTQGIVPANIHAIVDGEATITQQIADPRVFSVLARYTFKPVVIHFSETVNGTNREISTDTFLVKRIPDPMPILNGKIAGGYVSKKEFLAMSGVVALTVDHTVPARFMVTGFDMVYSSKGKLLTSHSNGPLFNAEMLQWINQAQQNDIFIINGIGATGPDSMRRILRPMSFILIE